MSRYKVSASLPGGSRIHVEVSTAPVAYELEDVLRRGGARSTGIVDFGTKRDPKRPAKRDAAYPKGYDVLRYSSGKSYVALADGRPDYKTRQEAARAADQANNEWQRKGRPTLIQEANQFFTPVGGRDKRRRPLKRTTKRYSKGKFK